LSQYVGFRGRATPSEFWWFVLFAILVLPTLAALIDVGLYRATGNPLFVPFATQRFDVPGQGEMIMVTGGGAVSGIAGWFVLLPGLAVAARRLHDTGRSGWWLLLWLVVIIGWFVLVLWWIERSWPEENRFGAPPLVTPQRGAAFTALAIIAGCIAVWLTIAATHGPAPGAPKGGVEAAIGGSTIRV
jgi:uncharacterized membrane protein YhaH (DUF805 family)